MAQTVEIISAEPVGKGKVAVLYCDPANPGSRYGCEAKSASSANINAAIAAHIKLRKDAGLDYAGMAEAKTGRTVTL